MEMKRNAALDVAKGLTLLTLPPIHTTLLYGNKKVKESNIGKFLAFIAENAGAPLFMLAMGISITLTEKKTTSVIIRRGLSLLLSGYLLNTLKFVIPYLLKILPGRLLEDMGIEKGKREWVQLLMSGDILHLAAISYPVSAFVYKKKHYPLYALAAILFISIYSRQMWKFQPKGLLKYFTHLWNGMPPQSYFPFFPWGTYALAGLMIGTLTKNKSSKRSGISVALAGSLFIIAGGLLQKIEPRTSKEEFYRMCASGTFIHIGRATFVFALCYPLTYMRKKKKILQWVCSLSSHITTFYQIQWIAVYWMLPLFGYSKSGKAKTCAGIFTTTILSALMTRLYVRLKKHLHF